MADFPTALLFDACTPGGWQLEFLDETYPTKIRWMWFPCSENFMILCSTVFVWYTRVTDGRAIAYSALYAIRCRALKITQAGSS